MSPAHARVAAASIGSLPLLIFGVLPLLALARGAHPGAIDGDRLVRTGALAILATLGALAIGVLVGIALSRRGRGAPPLRCLLLLPALVPPVMIAQGWTTALRPDGLASRIVESCGGAPARAIEALESPGGAAFVLATCFAPFVALLVEAAIAAVPRASFEAARGLGASERQAFRVAAGSSVARAALAASCLVFVLAAGECGAPTLLDVDVLGHEVLVQLAAFPDFGAAAAAAIPLALLGASAFALARAALRPLDARDEATSPGLARADSTGATRGTTLALGVVLAGIVAPPFLAWIVSARPADYDAAIELAGSPMSATLKSALPVAALATACGAALAWSGRSGSGPVAPRAGLLLPWLALALLAVPSVLLGLGVTALPILARHGEFALPGVLVARHVAVAWLVLAPRFAALPTERIESALSLGASPSRVMTRIALPALARPLGAAFLLVFVLAAQDLGATSLLHAPGRETFPVALLSIEANSPRGVVAAFALLGAASLVLAGLAAASLAGLPFSGRSRARRGEEIRGSANPRGRSAGLLR